MNEIEKQAITKAIKKLKFTGKPLDLETDVKLFTKLEMDALIKMNKDNTMETKFAQIMEMI